MRILILQKEIQRESNYLEVQQTVPQKVGVKEGDREYIDKILPSFQAGQREGAAQVIERPIVHLNFVLLFIILKYSSLSSGQSALR